MKKIWRGLVPFCVAILLVLAVPAFAQSPQGLQPDRAAGSPVLLNGKPLFVIQESSGSETAAERSQEAMAVIQQLAQDASIPVESLQIGDQNGTTVIFAGQEVVTRITPADAQAVDSTPRQLAEDYLQILKNSVRQYRQTLPEGAAGVEVVSWFEQMRQQLWAILNQGDRSLGQSLFGVLLTTLGLLLLLFLLNRVIPQFVGGLIGFVQQRVLPRDRLQHLDRLTQGHFSAALADLAKTTRWIITLGLILIYVFIVLSFFPQTNKVATGFFAYSADAIQTIWEGVIGYVPNLFIIAIVLLFAYYALRFIKPIFDGLESGEISVTGFYQDWAIPTYRIVEVCIYALVAVIIFPYLPGFGSPAFQGISLFIGVLFSLGSSAALSNAIAGIILIYTRSFQVGDRVDIGGTVGDVEDKMLLVTRIRTTNNVIVTIPNSELLTSKVSNFSASQRETNQPVKLSATLGFDYDLPWRTVYDLLRECAEQTDGILDDPPPLIRHNQLDNFELLYQIKVAINDPTCEDDIYSELYQRICDRCHELGIEMLTPSYSAIRDGNHAVIPSENLPDNYTPKGFHLNPLGNLFQVDLKMGSGKSNGKSHRSTHTS
ncbi:MAG: mechanosensitive ion channel family protein [Elainellaceae cyanobacterium]